MPILNKITRQLCILMGKNGVAMLQRGNNFSEYELAEQMKKGGYIQVYAKQGATKAKVPYMDLPTGEKKFVEFELFEGVGWVYVDNNQEEG